MANHLVDFLFPSSHHAHAPADLQSLHCKVEHLRHEFDALMDCHGRVRISALPSFAAYSATLECDDALDRLVTFQELRDTLASLYQREIVPLKSSANVPGNTTTDQHIGRNLSVGNDASIARDLKVGGTATVDGKQTVQGASLLVGDVTMGGDANIAKDLAVMGNSRVNGSETVGQDLTVKKNAYILGNQTINGTLDVTKQAHFAAAAIVDGSATIGQDLHVVGNSRVDGSETVGQHLTVQKNAYIMGNQTVSGTLDVTKQAHFAAAAIVDGSATIGEDLNVAGNASIRGKMKVGDTFALAGAATFGGTLDVAGDTTLSGRLTVTSNIVARSANVASSSVGSQLPASSGQFVADSVRSDAIDAIGSVLQVGAQSSTVVVGSTTGATAVKGQSLSVLLGPMMPAPNSTMPTDSSTSTATLSAANIALNAHRMTLQTSASDGSAINIIAPQINLSGKVSIQGEVERILSKDTEVADKNLRRNVGGPSGSLTTPSDVGSAIGGGDIYEEVDAQGIPHIVAHSGIKVGADPAWSIQLPNMPTPIEFNQSLRDDDDARLRSLSLTQPLSVASGGTGSTVALSNGRLLKSKDGAMVECETLGEGAFFVGGTGVDAQPVAAMMVAKDMADMKVAFDPISKQWTFSLTNKLVGHWSSDISYVVRNLVVHNDALYCCVRSHNATSTIPANDTNSWELLISAPYVSQTMWEDFTTRVQGNLENFDDWRNQLHPEAEEARPLTVARRTDEGALQAAYYVGNFQGTIGGTKTVNGDSNITFPGEVNVSDVVRLPPLVDQHEMAIRQLQDGLSGSEYNIATLRDGLRNLQDTSGTSGNIVAPLPWQNGKMYRAGQSVYHQGNFWACIAGYTNAEPRQYDPSSWRLVDAGQVILAGNGLGVLDGANVEQPRSLVAHNPATFTSPPLDYFRALEYPTRATGCFKGVIVNQNTNVMLPSLSNARNQIDLLDNGLWYEIVVPRDMAWTLRSEFGDNLIVPESMPTNATALIYRVNDNTWHVAMTDAAPADYALGGIRGYSDHSNLIELQPAAGMQPQNVLLTNPNGGVTLPSLSNMSGPTRLAFCIKRLIQNSTFQAPGTSILTANGDGNVMDIILIGGLVVPAYNMTPHTIVRVYYNAPSSGNIQASWSVDADACASLRFSSTEPVWRAGSPYFPQELITAPDGGVYRCLRGHTSNYDLEPKNDPERWALVIHPPVSLTSTSASYQRLDDVKTEAIALSGALQLEAGNNVLLQRNETGTATVVHALGVLEWNPNKLYGPLTTVSYQNALYTTGANYAPNPGVAPPDEDQQQSNISKWTLISKPATHTFLKDNSDGNNQLLPYPTIVTDTLRRVITRSGKIILPPLNIQPNSNDVLLGHGQWYELTTTAGVTLELRSAPATSTLQGTRSSMFVGELSTARIYHVDSYWHIEIVSSPDVQTTLVRLDQILPYTADSSVLGQPSIAPAYRLLPMPRTVTGTCTIDATSTISGSGDGLAMVLPPLVDLELKTNFSGDMPRLIYTIIMDSSSILPLSIQAFSREGASDIIVGANAMTDHLNEVVITGSSVIQVHVTEKGWVVGGRRPKTVNESTFVPYSEYQALRSMFDRLMIPNVVTIDPVATLTFPDEPASSLDVQIHATSISQEYDGTSNVRSFAIVDNSLPGGAATIDGNTGLVTVTKPGSISVRVSDAAKHPYLAASNIVTFTVQGRINIIAIHSVMLREINSIDGSIVNETLVSLDGLSSEEAQTALGAFEFTTGNSWRLIFTCTSSLGNPVFTYAKQQDQNPDVDLELEVDGFSGQVPFSNQEVVVSQYSSNPLWMQYASVKSLPITVTNV